MGLGGAVDLPAIRQRIVVDDSALSGLGSRVGKIGKTLGLAVAGGAAVAAAGIGAFVSSGVSGAIDVERGISEVVTLFGETGDAARSLGDELAAGVADLSNEVGIAQDALVGGLYQAISAGVPKDNAFEFLRVASEASIAGVTDVETAIDGITTTINAFGLEASDASAISDSMFAAVQGGKTTFEELSASMSNVAPAAAAAGVGFGEVNAAIATLTAAGVPTAQATTQLRAALVGLQKPSEEMDEIFRALGYTNAQTAIEAEGLGFALGAVSDAADGDNGKLTTLLGSVEAVGAAQVLAGTGAEKFAAELERQENSAGSAGDAFETMNATTSRAIDNLRTQFTNAAIAVGSEVLPKLNEVVRWATERLPGAIETVKGAIGTMVETFRTIATVVGEVVTTVQEHWETIKAAAITAAAVVAVAFGPGWVATMVAKATAAVTSAATTVAAWVSTQAAAIAAAATHSAQVVKQVASWVLLGTQSLVQAARVAAAWLISLGPIALVIAAVVGLVALIVKNWDKIRETISAGWEFVKRVTTEVWDSVTSWLSETWDSIVGAVTGAWDTIVGKIGGARQSVKDATLGAISSVLTWLTELPGRIVTALVGLTTSVLEFVNRYHPVLMLWRAGQDVLPDLVAFVAGIPGRIIDALGNVGRMLYDSGVKIVQGLIDGIRSMIGKVGDAIGSVAGKVRDFLPFSPAKEGPLSGSGSPDRAGRKVGAMVADGLASSTHLVAAASSRLAAAASVNATGRAGILGGVAAAGAGGTSYTFTGNIVLPNVTDRSTADDLLAGLRQAVRQGARV